MKTTNPIEKDNGQIHPENYQKIMKCF